MSDGIATLGITVEFSDEVPPVAPSGWNEVKEVKSVTPNRPEPSLIPFTHLKSTAVDERYGLSNPGSYEIVGNYIPDNAEIAEIHGTLRVNREQRWWRITYPKRVSTNGTASSEQFAGQVGSSGPTTGDENSPVDFTFSLRVNSDYTWTAESA